MATRVVRLMLVHRDELVPEDRFFDAFWRGNEPGAARRALHVALSHARRVLDGAEGVERSVLETSERCYRLRVEETTRVDTHEFEMSARHATAATNGSSLPLLEQAEKLWNGPPLPEDLYSDWSAAWRERLMDRYSEVLSALIGAYADTGDVAAETLANRKLVELDPLNEGAQRALMTVYARAGRRGDALRQYGDCERLLSDGLGVEPAAATSSLRTRVLAGEAPDPGAASR
jgi:DNA-binding SARP family transcriptional activator